MIWKLICLCSSRLFHEVKRFIVSLVRKLCIQYFNKIKLNFFAYDVLFFFFLLKNTENSTYCIFFYWSCRSLELVSAAVEAGKVCSWHQIILPVLFVHKHSKIPHMCKTWWQGVMFVVAVATWCNLTGDPVQTRHQGIPPLAYATVHCIATGKLSGTSHSTREGRGGKRTVIFCCSVIIQHVL